MTAEMFGFCDSLMSHVSRSPKRRGKSRLVPPTTTSRLRHGPTIQKLFKPVANGVNRRLNLAVARLVVNRQPAPTALAINIFRTENSFVVRYIQHPQLNGRMTNRVCID